MNAPKYVILDGVRCKVLESDRIDLKKFRTACLGDVVSRTRAAGIEVGRPVKSLKYPWLECYKETVKFTGLDYETLFTETICMFPWKVIKCAIKCLVHTQAMFIGKCVLNVLEIPFLLIETMDILASIFLVRKDIGRKCPRCGGVMVATRVKRHAMGKPFSGLGYAC